ncbi:MAG: hypothetical protein ACRECA_09430 [Pseudolabrys sp.]
MNTNIGSDLCLLADEELDVVAGGQQLYSHEFPGAVNRQTGLRYGDGPIVANDVPLGSLYFYGSTDNNLP